MSATARSWGSMRVPSFMVRVAAATVLAGALMVVAACGGSSPNAASGTSAGYPNASVIAAKIGCTNDQPIDEIPIPGLPRAATTTRCDSTKYGSVKIFTYASSDQLQQVQRVVSQFLTSSKLPAATIVVGSNWYVQPDSAHATAAAALATQIGGVVEKIG